MTLKQSWEPIRERRLKDFMERGFQEFYYKKEKARGRMRFDYSSVVLALGAVAICVTALFV